MHYTTVAISKPVKEKLKNLSTEYRIPMGDILSTMILFFDKNKSIVNADFFQKSESESADKLNEKLTRSFEKVIKKEVNRLIGFLKVQDRFMRIMKKDILHKITIDESDDEYHPLFQDYEYIISILKEILKSKSIETDEDILNEIKLLKGNDILEYYKESELKVMAKKLFID